MEFFTVIFSHPIEVGLSILFATAMSVIFLRAAMAPESRSAGWIRFITSSNARLLFGILFVGWAISFGPLISFFPNTAESPYGALALIALFTGFFIMMGFLWAVIGE